MKTVKLFVVAAGLALFATTARPDHTIYPDPAQARADLTTALKTAAATHKRVIVDFGGDWCGDCQVLDIYFHNTENLPILESNFVLVHINVGKLDQNLALAEQFGIPITTGVPALAVLSEDGKVLYAQRGGEFKTMRKMQSSEVTRFLVQWRPAKHGCSAVMLNC